MDYIFIKSKKTGKDDFGTVYARIRSNGNNKKYSTGFVIRETEWLKFHLTQFFSSNLITSLGIKYGQFATVLAMIKAAFEADFDPETAPAVIRSIKASVLNGEQLHVKPSRKQREKILLFIDYITQYTEDLKTGKRLKKGTSRLVSTGYLNKIIALKNNLSLYETERRKTLTINDITMGFQRDYMKWNRDRGASGNTISSQLSNIRTIMQTAYESKLTTVDDFRRSDFVPKWEDVDHIYLTPKQVTDMYEADIFTVDQIKECIDNLKIKQEEKDELLGYCSENIVKKLELVRDIFIVGCLCGQRISDYSRICTDMMIQIENATFISLVQEKTKKKVIFPMDSRIAIILEKYNGKFPKITEQDFNKHIKVLAKILGWTHKAKIDKERMGSKSGNRFCDMISSHTARRTFATNAYAAGIPLGSIMAVTGHSSEKTLRRYLKLQAEEKAIIAAKDFEGVMFT